jgi:hypothetical protein
VYVLSRLTQQFMLQSVANSQWEQSHATAAAPAGSCMMFAEIEIAGPNQSSMDLARRPSEVELNVTWTRYTSEMHMLVGAELAAHAAYIGTQGAGASAWPG